MTNLYIHILADWDQLTSHWQGHYSMDEDVNRDQD